jgi:hypothetical protein
MEAVFGNNPALRAYGALGQGEASPMPPINNGQDANVQQVWQGLRITCIGLLGEDTCARLLGVQPFFCPPADEKPSGACTLKTLAIAVGVGVVIGKIIL